MNNRFASVLHRIRVWQWAGKRLATLGPHFKIVHRFRIQGSHCLPGEEVAWVILVHRGREYILPLPLALLLLFDYLAQNRRFPQSAAQIVAGLRTEEFYLRHGANGKSGVRRTRRFSCSGLKVYVERIRRALERIFNEAGLKLDPASVLRSVPLESNSVGYQLRATVQWIHI